MKSAKVKILKKANFKGEVVPSKLNGRAGRYIEKRIAESGYKVSSNKGIDLPEERVEVKSRDIDSVSPETVGTMSEEDIINTDYENSIICEKLQQQYRVITKEQVVISNDVRDYSYEGCQQIAKDIYNAGREVLKKGSYNNYIKGTKYGYWESKRPGYWDFRFRDGTYEMFDKMILNKDHWKNLFQEN